MVGASFQKPLLFLYQMNSITTRYPGMTNFKGIIQANPQIDFSILYI